ncbi:DUF6448 family protein [Phenylobacterium soli]|uniref:DUF4142 domain-containing protein n=1 Tax=Phenylobacterium soli TaxID=2170551 RepID=A0A328AR06_9CAUL|nr:DUF6448 family protein [Phenylobacterium soli]RAK55944.1 hypothetical protein DJ017_16220 [Phenylobacterium soli]
MSVHFSRLLAAVAAAVALPAFAWAHCDAIDGPVAQAATTALQERNVNIALPYAPAAAEPEIRAQFERALKVRSLGPDARALADRSFMETVVRLHRQGEGAPYDGLKPAGVDHGPAIPAAEAAVATGDLSKVRAVLAQEVDAGLAERLAHVRATQASPAQARTAEDVPRVRERVSAELGLVTYAEGVRQAAQGLDAHHEN